MKKFISFILFCGFVLTTLFLSCEGLINHKNIQLQNPTISSIFISQKPTKLNYDYEDALDLTGLIVKAKYNDGSEKVIDGWTSEPTANSRLSTSGTVTVTISYEEKTTSFTITVTEKPLVTSNNSFWGTWVRMDNGQEYEVLETSVVQGSNNYKVTASDSTTLTVNSLGKFTKESDGVIVCNNIPYYRKGGANLEYSLKLVGFTTNERAAGIVMSGIKGKGRSEKYKNFESDGESDSNGEIKLKAPTANDIQTVEISNGNDLVVIPGLKINNSGDYMGTVALVGKDDYNLKITGTISDDQKDNGYLFGNNAKTYNMVLTIQNISENKCSTSACFIQTDDINLKIESTDGTDLDCFTISTLAGGATKTVNISVEYGELDKSYVDTGITVTIQNPFTQQEWNDYIPLRFFKGKIPITIAAKNPENNNNAALNGFIIYPDGNNQFFAINNNSSKSVFVPTFGNEKPYMLVFSGATVTSHLDDSTEMYYTVEPASIDSRPVVTSGNEILNYITFGGDNHSEDTAYSVTESFEAYLREGEIDYYSIIADSDVFYGPDGFTFYSVNYVNEKGDVPDSFIATDGDVLSTKHLPEMTCDGYRFLGWYSGETKVTADEYTVNDNIILNAKWQLESYSVDYELNGGTNHAANPSTYTIESSSIVLQTPVRIGYDFSGWYGSEGLTGSAVESIGGGTTGGITLYAKWTPIAYKIMYELNGGTNAVTNPATYTIETETITLAEPQKDGFTFIGWYTYSNFSGTKQTKIEKGSHVDKNYYAKWLKKCTVSYVTAYSTAPTSIIVGEGEKLTAEQLPELTSSDYYFCGWYLGETDIRIMAGSYKVTDDITLKAHWSTNCMVSYSSDHGTVPDSFYVPCGTTLTAANLASLNESGWKFFGWYKNSNFDEASKVSAGQIVSSSITLYAKWEEYTVPDDSFVFVEGGIVVGSNDYNQNYMRTGAFPVGRTVTLSSFYISDHELTQGEYETYCCYTEDVPSTDYGVGPDYPAYNVSWYDAVVYCNLRSMAEGLIPCYSISGETDPKNWTGIKNNNGKYSCNCTSSNSIWNSISCNMVANGYRLPTEAEWEYAARGGHKTYGTDEFADYFAGISTSYCFDSISSDLDAVGWYYYNVCNNEMTINDPSDENLETSNENLVYGTHEVKKKASNALGLYDMSGNVWEWCWDQYSGEIGAGNVTNPYETSSKLDICYHIQRGGSWCNDAYYCSVSTRSHINSYSRNYDTGFRLVCSAKRSSNNTESGNSNVNQSYSLTSTVIILPSDTNGTAGIDSTYVLFGDWPQTIKEDDVVVDESVREIHGVFTYYGGNDGNWYVKCEERASDSGYTYSNGTSVKQGYENSTQYFKVEPIKWRILTENYNGTGKALLLAENILTANMYYEHYSIDRTINGSTIYPNNYKESEIRAYLNGLAYYQRSSSSASLTTNNIYLNKGFLQTAFSAEAQNLIATTMVDNSAESTTDNGNNITQATEYACSNTNDKIFLLSEKEVTTSNYVFASNNSDDNTRIKVPTDFAKANRAYLITDNGYGGLWWLRSPHYDFSYDARTYYDGDDYSCSNVYYDNVGVAPALTISLQ